jgi:hypothetical protein
MDSPIWWLFVALTAGPVLAVSIAAIAYGLYLDKKIEEEERHLPPAE